MFALTGNGKKSIVLDTELLGALVGAGLTPDLRHAIVNDEKFALAFIEKGEELLGRDDLSPDLDMQRELLNSSLEHYTSLSTQIRNILMLMGLDTIGDLALTSETLLLHCPGIGAKSMQDIEEVLSGSGFNLMGEREDAFSIAKSLYGDAEYIPAKYMEKWQEGLDRLSIRYLRDVGTLGQLATNSPRDFHSWRETHSKETEPPYMRKLQTLKLVNGLAKAELTLRGE